MNEEATPGLEVVQYIGLPTQNSFAPPILLAKIDWDQFSIKELVGDLFFNGILSLLSISTGEDVPLFFGPKLQAMIRAYARGHGFEAYIIYKLPRYNGKEVFPAAQYFTKSP